ncbi:helix-turn-helix domain-containing protein [Vibrio superstes]|uniref:HTH araC/xylS-type domain-containing protein n=1 Tax=Vibrio superstes NBRC 103154 TaxID=1219062 RepID=A0A511QR53_9VIBR|nr:AraC family transcriptional regulator [Vibrio superstes]GEM79818.1 hypothetical protein VSU01S_20630 [Vibrio superstes NBRC 103154]
MSKQNTITLINTLMARPILKHAQSLGIDIKAILDKETAVGTYDQLMYLNEGNIAGYPLRVLMQTAVELGYKDFGVQASLTLDASEVVALVAQTDNSVTNLYDALVAFCLEMNRYLSTFNFFEMESTNGGVFLRRNQHFVVDLGNEPMELYSISMLIQLIRYYLNKEWQPDILWLTSAKPEFSLPDPLTSNHFFYQKPVGKLFISDVDLQLPVISHSDKHKAQYKKLRPKPDLTHLSAIELVKNALIPYAMDALPKFDQLSMVVGCHSKQLQLKLAQEGSGFRQIVLQIKKERAEELMKNTDFDLARIAIELGYQNPTHFSRAMKALMGMTPNQRLKQLR